jgi:hypothetical protein
VKNFELEKVDIQLQSVSEAMIQQKNEAKSRKPFERTLKVQNV